MTRTVTLAALLIYAALSHAGSNSWTLTTGIDAASYQSVSTLSQDSLESIPDEYGVKEVRPRLQFRCEPGGDGAVRMRIDWQRFISSFNTEVTFEADGGKPQTLKLGVDRTNKITMSREAKDDQALVDLLTDRKLLTVNVTPYSEAPISVQFETAGFNDSLERLKASCKL